MYFSRHKHLLSVPMMLSALARLACSTCRAIIRIIMNRNNSMTPDMINTFLWRVQTFFSFFEIVVIAVVFYLTWKKLTCFRDTIEADDRKEIGRLQEETLGTKLSSLSAEAIMQLLQLWAVILIGAESVYYISSLIYRRVTSQLILLITDVNQYKDFFSIYNQTHGFKYLAMLTAILLGIMMTAIFLRDRRLGIAVLMIAVLFLFAFGILQMQTITFTGREIGIVWTSVIFHLTETVGLFGFSVYLAKHYKGL